MFSLGSISLFLNFNPCQYYDDIDTDLINVTTDDNTESDMKRTYWIIFGVTALLNALLLVLFMRSLLSMETFERLFSAYASEDTIVENYETVHSISSYMYIVVSLVSIIMSFIRVLITSLILYVMSRICEVKSSFATMMSVSVCAEIVYPLQMIARIIYVSYIQPSSVAELSVIPLSLLSIFGDTVSETWMVVFLNQINLFEILYIVILMVCVKRQHCNVLSWQQSIDFVFFSYVACYSVYVLMITSVCLIS